MDGVARGAEPNVSRGMRGEDVIGFEVRGSQYAMDAVILRDSGANAGIVLGEKPRVRRRESITLWRSSTAAFSGEDADSAESGEGGRHLGGLGRVPK